MEESHKQWTCIFYDNLQNLDRYELWTHAPQQHRSFLENVAGNRELVRTWETAKAGVV